jgi:hypothetical protein
MYFSANTGFYCALQCLEAISKSESTVEAISFIFSPFQSARAWLHTSGHQTGELRHWAAIRAISECGGFFADECFLLI